MKLTEIGVSQREAYERCPVYWYHAYCLGDKGWGIEPTNEPVATLWGTICHAGLAEFYRGLSLGGDPLDLVKPAVEAMVKIRDERLAAFRQAFGQDYVPEDSEAKSDVRLCDCFMKGYVRFHLDDKLLNVIAVEKDFSLPTEAFYPSDLIEQVCKAVGVDPSMLPNPRGTIDLIYETASGARGVMDHKFNSYVDTDLDWGISHWKQPLVYSRAASILFDKPISEYTHNQIRKPSNGLKPRYDKASDTYESPEEFRTRLAREYLDFPDYRYAYPDRKKGYFYRSVISDPPFGDRRFLAELLFEDCLMARTAATLPDLPGFTEPPPWIPRRDARGGCKHYGKSCVYSKLCDFGYNPATKAFFVDRFEPHP